MKHQESIKNSTKKGAASIYVVVFVSLLFSVITVTFVRSIISNSVNTENNDLSQSAYDAALSGVEDAKRAIEKYALCKKNPSSFNDCQKVIDTIDNINDTDTTNCNMVNQILYGIDDGEVIIKEKTNTNDEAEIEDEAYTCVTINPAPSDYRAKLTTANPVRVIQLNAEGEYDTIEISWHSSSNSNDRIWSDEEKGKKFDTGDPIITPAILAAGLIYPGAQANFSSFDEVPRSTVFMVPDTKKDTSIIGQKDLNENSNQKPENGYEPFPVKCNGTDYLCTQSISPVGLTQTMPKESEVDYLILSLPYGQPETDFAITLKNNGRPVKFNKAQYEVDSTGRSNDVYRRVKSRVEANDNYFPYPEFAIEISGEIDTDGKLKKIFYVTRNCEKIDNGVLSGCPDSKDLN